MTGIFQQRVSAAVVDCFGESSAFDLVERRQRFLEEAIELFQSCGGGADEAHQMVNWVLSKPLDAAAVEVGNVAFALAALGHALNIDVETEGERDLQHVIASVPAIRKRHALKPRFPSPPTREIVA